MILGERIRKLRGEQGLSQEQLADLIGVSRQSVSKWETGESTPDTERLIQLCRVLHVSADFLLFGVAATSVSNEEAPSSTPKKTCSRSFTVAAWITTAIGGIGLLVMWVLSTMLVSERWTEVATTNSSTGETYYELQMYGVYDFASFIETYRLQALLLICIVLLAIGCGLLLWRWWKTRFPDKLQ